MIVSSFRAAKLGRLLLEVYRQPVACYQLVGNL